MNTSLFRRISAFMAIATLLVISACNPPVAGYDKPASSDSLDQTQNDSLAGLVSGKDSLTAETAGSDAATKRADMPRVLVYNFHVTNRCVACIAIEDATTKTLNTYFASETKQGRIKRYIVNVDDDANKAISEKYQAFGSGISVTRVFKGKESTTDLTGEGFKYAKNKEEKFIEILKMKITEYLK